MSEIRPTYFLMRKCTGGISWPKSFESKERALEFSKSNQSMAFWNDHTVVNREDAYYYMDLQGKGHLFDTEHELAVYSEFDKTDQSISLQINETHIIEPRQWDDWFVEKYEIFIRVGKLYGKLYTMEDGSYMLEGYNYDSSADSMYPAITAIEEEDVDYVKMTEK